MSNIYIQEPPTNGKVLLQTTVGDIDVELWSKEAPRACRNFIQLCMEGYYNGTIFHRVIKDFIVQGGDPTGTGHGGESIYGKPFRDEFHSRLRFNHRGLVAMANAGPNDNGSQFFFTLGATPELDRKHTIFGKVAGNTIYNMLKLNEAETDSDDRPLYPHKITKTKILYNPFEDIVPRVVKKEDKEEDSKRKKSKAKATKNFSLLSFGEEAEEDEEEVNKVVKVMKHKSKSSHDLLNDKKLSSIPAVEVPGVETGKRAHEESESSDSSVPSAEEMTQTEKDAMKERIRKKLKTSKDGKEMRAETDRHNKRKKRDSEVKDDTKQKTRLSVEEEEDRQTVGEAKPSDEQMSAGKSQQSDEGRQGENKETSTLEKLREEAKMLKRELINKKKTKDIITEEKTKKSQNEVLLAYEEERKKYMDRKVTKNKSAREKETLAILAKFQSKLSATRRIMEYDEDEEEEEEKKADTDEDDPNDLSWMNHKLKFDSRESKVIDANINDADRYEIFDPRNPLTQRRREASKKAMKEKR